ncbi:sperm-specific protein PHI-2B-like [Portunus trituberculatus]|uniref:sperm-specific protein PHI-2B-like n=1 Tax=Portunus trituberculatus TaxID=210409 RepID=UPI001E1CF5C2|nr:sperm-specific protein PHI-2B-like [Portunus trituberculatus]XP_045103093.1 sperm-specific protein PHI-2B-like [Portunus trituberculatus]
MSEDDSRGVEEVTVKEEEVDTDSGEKTEKEEEPVKDEEAQEEDKSEEPQPPKKRGRKPGSGASPAKKVKKEKEKGAEGGTKRKRKPVKKHPKTMDMIVEAIDRLGEKRGSSVQAIKAYIAQNFKTVRMDMIKSMLRRSLTMGLQQGIVARPKAQADTQVMSGRYLLGKAAKMEDEDEVMPQQSKRAQEAKKSAKKLKKKAGSKPKKSPKKPVARKVSQAKAKRPIKKARRGRK